MARDWHSRRGDGNLQTRRAGKDGGEASRSRRRRPGRARTGAGGPAGGDAPGRVRPRRARRHRRRRGGRGGRARAAGCRGQRRRLYRGRPRRERAGGAALIHYSTDYVFDGTKPGAYVEDDPVNPLGVYGRTKAAGERAVRAALERHVILRTSWVYAAHGRNFVRTMLRLADERGEVRVVADQHGAPTAAADIAAATLRIAAQGGPWGTFHFANAGETTWHGFAAAIFALAGKTPRLSAIATAEFPTATRPANSRLDCAKLAAAYGIVARPWQEALAPVVAELTA